MISFSLSQLQSLLLGTEAAPSQALLQPDVLAALDVSVTGCAVTLSCLDDELRSLVPKLEKNQGLGFVDKAGFIFKDQKLKDLSNQLRGQCGGITFLLSCLQMTSMEERHRSVHNNQAMIQNIAHKAQSLRELYPKVKVAQSLLDAPSEAESIFGDTRASIISDREFEFDDLVVNSQAYRRALKAVERDLRKGDHQHDEGNLIDLGDGMADTAQSKDVKEKKLSLGVEKTSLREGKNVLIQGAAETDNPHKTFECTHDGSEGVHNNSRNVSSMSVAANSLSIKPGQAIQSIVQGWADEHRAREGQSTHRPSVPSASAIARGGQPTTTEDKLKNFYPHAFERWETLSAHWEGLTSFWIRQIQENTAEFNRDPSSEQLARQVHYLSNAGKSLFDAVVDLQRLRASSERKFQRWFFETRKEQERVQEVVALLEKTLQEERTTNQVTLMVEKGKIIQAFQQQLSRERTNLEARISQLHQESSEQRQYISSAKEEARRAWEELGRREQEERIRHSKMESCKPVMVGGVVLFPLKSSSWDQDSESRPLLYEVALAPKVPEPWVAHWDGENDKWLFVNTETKESGYSRPKPAPRPRPTNKNNYAASNRYSVSEATGSLSLTPEEDEVPESLLLNASAE